MMRAIVMADSLSPECLHVLALLSRSRNVLLTGAPGTGKSKLLGEVSSAFESAFGVANATTFLGDSPNSSSNAPLNLNPINGIPIPYNPPQASNTPIDGNSIPSIVNDVISKIPASNKSNRKVFRTVFHQNSKYRDFVSGITPSISKSVDEPAFSIVKGTLYKASEHAKEGNSASLLIIDEINRGPAVQIFGGAIVAIEPDKRLAPDGSKRTETQFFEMLDPEKGNVSEYALPADLYILAAMNQADASVEPLDVAFLRRWEPLRLEPDENALRNFYGLGLNDGSNLPDSPATKQDALEASVRAWIAINKQISFGRGPDYQIGHGVLMTNKMYSELSLQDILAILCVGWSKVRAHVEEVFFGDIRGISATLNALDGPTYNPFSLTEMYFADDLRFMLDGPTNFSESDIYPALKAFARE